MLESHHIEELICAVAGMDRAAVIERLLRYPSRFPTDFTAEFLGGLETERLRHVYVALCMKNSHVPVEEGAGV